jgi:hypothetical protein
MKVISVVVGVATSVAAFGVAQSQEFPSTGIVYNTIDTASIVHRCNLTDKLTMDCEFTQTAIRRKLSAEDATKKLAEAKAEFAAKPPSVSQTECAQYETMSMILQGKKAAPDMQGLSKLTGRMKSDALLIMNQFVAFCRDPSIDNWMKIVSTSIDRDKRTCSVSSNSFSQKFRRSDTSTWTVVSQPYGPCGVVQLDRFEADKTKEGPTFWNYFARKAVTNPNADAGLLSCKMLDEREYKYQWQKRDPEFSCDYVEFSPI